MTRLIRTVCLCNSQLEMYVRSLRESFGVENIDLETFTLEERFLFFNVTEYMFDHPVTIYTHRHSCVLS